MKNLIFILPFVLLQIGCRDTSNKNDYSIAKVKLSNDQELNKDFSDYVQRNYKLLELRPIQLMGKSVVYRLTVMETLLESHYSIQISEMDSGFWVEYRTYDERSSELLSDSKGIGNRLDSLDFYVTESQFWKQNNDVNTCNGYDGTFYLLEFLENEKNNTILRWSPNACKVRQGEEFMDLVNYLVKTSQIKESNIW